MTAKTLKQTRLVRFDANRYDTLQLANYQKEYTPIGVSSIQKISESGLDANNKSLAISLQDDLLELIALTGSVDPATKEVNSEDILLVKSKNGVFIAAYGPAIFRLGDQPIIKIGANIAPITYDPASLVLTCGDLSGRLTFVPALDNGIVKYVNIIANLKASDNSVTFAVKIMTRDPEIVDGSPVVIDQPYVEGAIEQKDLHECLRPVPQGSGSSARKLAELEAGSYYQITACKTVNGVINGNPSTSFKLKFKETGDDEFWLNANHGSPHSLIKAGYNPVGKFLCIISIRQAPRGMSVQCAICDGPNQTNNAPML